MSLSHAIAEAAAPIADLLRAAIVLLPDGAVLATVGAGDLLDFEQLGRACARCFADEAASAAAPASPSIRSRDGLVEYVMLSAERTVVLQRSRAEPRLAFAVVCARQTNIALALVATREAIAALSEAAAALETGLLDG